MIITFSGFGLTPVQARAEVRPTLDCALRNAPFSTKLPLIDLMLDARSKAVVERQLPGMLTKMPAMMLDTRTPSFAAIITLKQMLDMGGTKTIDVTGLLAAIDAKLAKIPVTAADRAARCARYDDGRPELAIPPGHPRLLLFEKINGFKDTPSVNAAHAAFLDMAKAHGWSITTTDKGGAFTPARLRRFDAVIWNNISGDVLTLSERATFKSWIEHGGAYIGIHGSGGDPVWFWDWYVDTLLGARFIGHPYPKQFQEARVTIDDSASPIAAGLPHDWTLTEEWYSFKNNPRDTGAHIIATLDENMYEPAEFGKDIRMGKDHPIVWTRCVGQGRMFYSAIGHRPEMYTDPRYVTMLTNAVLWATGISGHKECAGQ
ncbi:MAG: ThuA domain-containing protein [Alphaproteobacteria bacterium]|nr:ThuA domain-containing protein [Alphaproteobacteria bacterium]MDE2339517.1 ThuA domain-containing protein [Alphaproteobacteria bacterium]